MKKMGSSYLDLFLEVYELEKNITDDLVAKKITISDIPETYLTSKMILTAMTAYQDLVVDIPMQKMDQNLWVIACAVNPKNMQFIDVAYKDWVKTNINEPLLRFVRPRDQTDFICLKLIELDARNIHWVKAELMSNDFVLQATVVQPEVINELGIKDFNSDLFNAVISSSAFELKLLPTEWISREVCQRAFEKNYQEVLNIPKEYIEVSQVKEALLKCATLEVLPIFSLLDPSVYDENTILNAICKNEACFDLLNDAIVTKDLIEKLCSSLKRYETLMNPLVRNVLDRELCDKLIGNNPLLLNGVPNEFKDHELCLKAISLNGMAVEALPHSLSDDELYRIAVSKNGLSLRHIPKPYRDQEIPMLAVQQNGEALEFVPDEMMSMELCEIAVGNNPYSIYVVPRRFRTFELLSIALESLPEVIKLMPVEMREIDLCVAVVKKNKELMKYVPEDVLNDVLEVLNEGICRAS